LRLNPENRKKVLGTERVIKGRGDYELGKNVGSKVGSWIGGRLHSWLSTLFGSGDYQMQIAGDSKPAGNSLIAGSSVPAMHTNGAGDVDISFHEYLGTIPMTETFSLRTFVIDPTDSNTFPWLSVFARGFQQWEPLGMVFVLKTLSSDVVSAPTQGMGSISGSIRYDVDSVPPGDLETLLNSVSASSAKPSINQMFPVECARSQTPISVLKVQQPGTTPGDLQFFRLGMLDIATVDGSNSYEGAAQLYVTYHIRFRKPRLAVNAGTSLMYFCDTIGTSLTNQFDPMPDTAAVKQPRVNTLGITLDHPTTGEGRYTFPLNIPTGSVYYAMWAKTSNVTTANVFKPYMSAFGGMAPFNGFCDQTRSNFTVPNNATNTSQDTAWAMGVYVYNGTGTASSPPSVLFGFTGATMPTPASSYPGTVMIMRVDSSVATGLTTHPSPMYTRDQFFQYLCDSVSGRRTKFHPPGEYRLVDWVQQFTKTNKWPVDKPLPRAPAAFDVTLLEAMGNVSRYTGGLPRDLESKAESAPAFEPDEQPVETEYQQVLAHPPSPVLQPPRTISRVPFK